MGDVLEQKHCSITMKESTLTGKTVEVVEFFGASGHATDDPSWWGMSNQRLDGYAMTPAPKTKTVDLIASFMPRGQEHRVGMIKVAPRMAVILYLEGTVTPTMVACAKVGPEYIDIPEIMICDRTVTLRVMNATKSALILADTDGGFMVDSGLPHDRRFVA